MPAAALPIRLSTSVSAYRADGRPHWWFQLGLLVIVLAATLRAQASPAPKDRPLARIPFRAVPVQVDGELEEWPGPPTIALQHATQVWSERRDPTMRWLGPEDLEAQFWIAYDASHLWIAGRVRDDGLVAGKVGAEWHQGDAIEIFLDLGEAPEGSRRGEFGAEVLQWFLMPFSTERPWGVMDWRNRPAVPAGATFTGVEFVCARETPTTYRFEASLPFHNIPKIAGREEIGFSIAIDDHDPDRLDRYQYLSWNGEQLVDHRENLGSLIFSGPSPLAVSGNSAGAQLGWLAAAVPYVAIAAGSLLLLCAVFWLWSRAGRRLTMLRPLGRVLGVVMLAAGLLLPPWAIEQRRAELEARSRRAAEQLVGLLPELESGLLGGYRGIDRDRTLLDLVDGRSIVREKRYRYAMHTQLCGTGPVLGARTRHHPGLGFEVRPYNLPLSIGEREVIAFRERVESGQLNLVFARSLPLPQSPIDAVFGAEPADRPLTVDISLSRQGQASQEITIALAGPFVPAVDLGLDRHEIAYRTIRLDQPIDAMALTCRSGDGAHLVGVTWFSSTQSSLDRIQVLPLGLGIDTLGGVPTDLRGPLPRDAGIELREHGGAATFPLVGVERDEFQKLWVVFSAAYRARTFDLAVGGHVAELSVRFAEPGLAPLVVPFQHQRTMFFDEDRANRELPGDGPVRIAHRFEGDDKDSRTDFVREVELPAGATPVAIELRNFGPYAIRFRSAVFGSEVRQPPVQRPDSPLLRDDRGERLDSSILSMLAGVDFAIYRGDRLSSATVEESLSPDRVVLPAAFRRIAREDGVRARTRTLEDAAVSESFVALGGEGWAGSVLAAWVTDPDAASFAQWTHRIGTILWLGSLPILLLLLSEVLVTLGSLRVRLVAVLSLASVVPLLVLAVVLVRVVEGDHEQKQREQLQGAIGRFDQQLAEQRRTLGASCEAWLGDLANAVRTRGLDAVGVGGEALREALTPILESQVPPAWSAAAGLEFEYSPPASESARAPVALFVGAESMRSLDIQLRSETGIYVGWGVPILGVRRTLELPSGGVCALSVARRIDGALLANLAQDRTAVLCDLRGYPLAASASEAAERDRVLAHARQPRVMAARETIAGEAAGRPGPVIARSVDALGQWIGAYGVVFDVQNTPRALFGVLGVDEPATLPLAIGRVPARAFFAAVAGLLVLIAVFLGFVVTNRISRPIERIERGAQALRRGDLDVQVESEEGGQIGRLTDTFNSMARELRARIDDLRLLNRGVQTLASRLDLGEVVNASVTFCMRHSSADDVRILLHDQAEDRIDVLGGSVAVGLERSEFTDTLFSALGPISVVGRSVPAALSDTLGRDRSIVALPMRLGGRPRGVLLLVFASPRPAEIDLDLLTTIATQTAAATENARLYQLAVEDVRTGALRPEYFTIRLGEEIARAERRGHVVALGGLRIADAEQARSVGARLVGTALERLVQLLRNELGADAMVTRASDFELRVAVRGVARETLADVIARAIGKLADPSERLPAVLSTLSWRHASLGYPRDAASTEFLIDALSASLTGQSQETKVVARDVGGNIVLGSPAMESVLRLLERIAPSDLPVLLCGETGTGKEVLADLVHRWSRRASGPLVKVHCAALPESLLASELFGHEKGAFTGATDRKLGRFEQAHGGTIFLDEIGEISLDVQVKLLRVLQEHEIERVGGSGTIAIDVRVLAATHRDLEAMVRGGTFREDLYYRLQGVLVRVPPLRERRAEIPALVEHFRREAVAAGQTTVEGLTPDALDELYRRDWRGNVRELRNTVLRAMVLARGPRVTRADLHGIEPTLAETQPESLATGAAGQASVGQPAVERLEDRAEVPAIADHAVVGWPDTAVEPTPPRASRIGDGSGTQPAAGPDSDLPVEEPPTVIPTPMASIQPPAIVDSAGGDRRREALVAFVRSRGEASSQECAAALGVSQRTALRLLVEATESGWLVRRGRRRGACYSLAEKSATAQIGAEESARARGAGGSASP
ncbi:MAG: sigma 54-interacting transcriptional regulator [Planctomycetota bacterium]